MKRFLFLGTGVVIYYMLLVYFFNGQKYVFPIFMSTAFLASMFLTKMEVFYAFIPLEIIWIIHFFLPDSAIGNVIIYLLFTPLTFLLGYYLKSKFLSVKVLYLVFLVFISIYAFPNLWSITNNFDARQNIKAPNITFYSEDGSKVRLDTVRNRIIVLDFWTTSCGVCFKEFPYYDSIYNKYKENSKVALYVVNIPTRRDTIGYAKMMIDQFNYQFPKLYTNSDSISNSLGFNRYPHSIILKDGFVRYNGNLMTEKEIWYYKLEDEIERVLNEDE